MATATYTFSTGVPNIQPAVYAVGTTTPDLNSGPASTNSAGVLSLDLDVGDYYAQWSWEGDTHQTGGEVASPNTLGEVAAGGSLPVPIAKTADYTAASGDAVLADATAAEVTITLPAPAAGASVWVKKTDASVNNVVIEPDGAETIDGAASAAITAQNGALQFNCDGSDWWVF